MKFHAFLVTATIVLSCSFLGCRLGYTPYDYAGATFPGGPPDERCDSLYRAGSYFNGTARPYTEDGSALYRNGTDQDCKECSSPHLYSDGNHVVESPAHTPETTRMPSPLPVKSGLFTKKATNASESGWHGSNEMSFPQTDGSFVISLEELQREDPSIREVKILNSGDETVDMSSQNDHGGFVPRL